MPTRCQKPRLLSLFATIAFRASEDLRRCATGSILLMVDTLEG